MELKKTDAAITSRFFSTYHATPHTTTVQVAQRQQAVDDGLDERGEVEVLDDLVQLGEQAVRVDELARDAASLALEGDELQRAENEVLHADLRAVGTVRRGEVRVVDLHAEEKKEDLLDVVRAEDVVGNAI